MKAKTSAALALMITLSTGAVAKETLSPSVMSHAALTHSRLNITLTHDIDVDHAKMLKFQIEGMIAFQEDVLPRIEDEQLAEKVKQDIINQVGHLSRVNSILFRIKTSPFNKDEATTYLMKNRTLQLFGQIGNVKMNRSIKDDYSRAMIHFKETALEQATMMKDKLSNDELEDLTNELIDFYADDVDELYETLGK